MPAPTEPQREHLHEHGWLIVDDAAAPELVARQREAVRSSEASAHPLTP